MEEALMLIIRFINIETELPQIIEENIIRYDSVVLYSIYNVLFSFLFIFFCNQHYRSSLRTVTLNPLTPVRAHLYPWTPRLALES